MNKTELNPVTSNAPIRHFEPNLDAGLGNTVVIGLIILSTDNLTELEMRRMLPDDTISFAATRIKNHNPVTVENLRAHVPEIAKVGGLYDPPGAVKVFAYGCTSGSAVTPLETFEEELRKNVPEGQFTSPMIGAFRAFEQLGIKRISLLTPYPDDVTQAMVQNLLDERITVCSSSSFHIDVDFEIVKVSPNSIVEAACEVNTSESQALFIPCTGLRTAGIIDELEGRLGKPVITAHQAMLWDALRLAGYRKAIAGHGQLLNSSR